MKFRKAVKQLTTFQPTRSVARSLCDTSASYSAIFSLSTNFTPTTWCLGHRLSFCAQLHKWHERTKRYLWPS